MTMDNSKLFVSVSQDSEESGSSPSVSTEDFDYTSYFENREGDQFIFAYDDDEEAAHIFSSSNGWDNEKVVEKGELEAGSFMIPFNLTDGVNAWLEGCTIELRGMFALN